MKPNVGGFDRSARVIIVVVLVVTALAAPLSMTWHIVLLLVGAIALITAAARV